MLNINVHVDDIHEDYHIELCDSKYITFIKNEPLLKKLLKNFWNTFYLQKCKNS